MRRLMYYLFLLSRWLLIILICYVLTGFAGFFSGVSLRLIGPRLVTLAIGYCVAVFALAALIAFYVMGFPTKPRPNGDKQEPNAIPETRQESPRGSLFIIITIVTLATVVVVITNGFFYTWLYRRFTDIDYALYYALSLTFLYLILVAIITAIIVKHVRAKQELARKSLFAITIVALAILDLVIVAVIIVTEFIYVRYFSEALL